MLLQYSLIIQHLSFYFAYILCTSSYTRKKRFC